MEDVTKKLSELLSTPEGMEKIKTVMGMFMDSSTSTGKQETMQESVQDDENNYNEEPTAKIAPFGLPNETNNLGFNLANPAMLSKIGSVFEAMNTKDDSRVNLLIALRPFLGNKRSSRLDNAVKMIQISKISNMFRK